MRFEGVGIAGGGGGGGEEEKMASGNIFCINYVIGYMSMQWCMNKERCVILRRRVFGMCKCICVYVNGKMFGW